MPAAKPWSVLVAGWIVLAAACQEDGGLGRAPDRVPPMRHAVHSEQLHKVMERMGRRVRRTWPQEIEGLKAEEARRDEQARFEDAAALAGALADASGLIPEAIAGSALSDQDRQVFLAEVDKLRGQAASLQARAAARDRAGMEATLGEIRTTCTNCHAQFREVAGPLKFGY